MRTISTIGYEGCDLDAFARTLVEAEVRHVLDIRDRPISRKPGFSKNLLSSKLASLAIGYTHIKALGDPKPGRDAMRAGRKADFLSIFNAHIDLPEGHAGLESASRIAVKQHSVLLCFESDHECCHRLIVANRMAQLSSLKVRHLKVRCIPAQGRRGANEGAFAFG